jgi:hypothetical protein
MPAQITNLFLLENLEDASRTRELAESDRNALRAVADWTTTFVAKPHRDLGRAGPVCPFVPVAWEHKTLWLAAERSAGRSAPDVIQLIDDYKRLLLQGNFDSYQMLRMDEAPAIEVHIIGSFEPPGGMGEAGTSAIVPAVTNAIFAATGKRLRQLPVDAAQLKAG